jgi:hypothetical protein
MKHLLGSLWPRRRQHDLVIILGLSSFFVIYTINLALKERLELKVFSEKATRPPLIALLISSYANHTTNLIIDESFELKVLTKQATWPPNCTIGFLFLFFANPRSRSHHMNDSSSKNSQGRQLLHDDAITLLLSSSVKLHD